jgi:glc operon protein GlcG
MGVSAGTGGPWLPTIQCGNRGCVPFLCVLDTGYAGDQEQDMSSTSTISTGDARRVLDAALEHVSALGAEVCVAVVDQGGSLKVLIRMDGASFLTATLATNKAITAAGLGVSTMDFVAFAATNPVVLAGLSTQPNLAILPPGRSVSELASEPWRESATFRSEQKLRWCR